MSEFFTPTYPEDLEVEQVGNRFYVKDVADLESPDVDASALLGGEWDVVRVRERCSLLRS